MKSLWVFDGPDWVAFSNPEHILPSLRITFSSFPKATITDLGESRPKGEAGWGTWTFKVSIPGKEDQLCKFRRYNLAEEPDHL